MRSIGEIIKKIFNIIFGIIFWSVIIWYLVTEGTILHFLVIAIVIFIVGLYYLIKRYNERNPKCEHGIRNGYTNGLCEECIREKEEHRIIYEEKESKRQLQQKIKDLRETELGRLRQNYLQKLDYLCKLNPYEFEDVIMQLYRNLGYKVIPTPYTNDKGKDGIAYKNEKKFLIECKRYEKDKRIGRPMLQKFFAAIFEEQAEKGFFITTAQFTQTAIDYAGEFRIELINGNRLIRKMKSVYSAKGNNDTFIQYCTQCRNILKFDLLDIRNAKSCIRCGTENTANITNSDMVNTTKKAKKKKYRRYYYR